MKTTDMQKLMDAHPELREKLFARGFLLTNAIVDERLYPFYGLWKHNVIGDMTILVAPNQKWYIQTCDECTMVLVGHAYNPFNMVYHEEVLLQELLERRKEKEAFEEKVNQMTGVFALIILLKDNIEIYGDCAGMQAVYYGYVENKLYISSHMQLIGDLCKLEASEYVKRLVNYRFYKFYGSYLPGNLSKYQEIKRLIPNTKVYCMHGETRVERFYPKVPLTFVKGKREYEQRIAEIGSVLQKSMEMIAKKWDKASISMTGGMDSKVTVAAANGLYDKFLYFSYDSMYGEHIDAEAAHEIANAIGVEHIIDVIPNDDNIYKDFEYVKKILEHNSGYIGKNNANDIRKRIYYAEKRSVNIEIKSWVSEVGRANYYKKFGRRRMPKRLSPRQMSSLYKFFLTQRSILKDTDRVFDEYISEVSARDIFNYDASDMFLWEVRYGSWGGHVITDEHKFSFDITVPYNNRLLMEMFLTLPLKMRISDQVHRDIVRLLNPKIADTGIEITNYNETKKRMWAEKIYFFFNTHIPF